MNHASGRGLVLATEGYVAFEVLGGTLSVGDLIDGDFMSHGRCIWNNLTTGQVVRVQVQHLMASMETGHRFCADRPPTNP